MAIHSSILPWRIPWTGELGEYRARGLKESDTTVLPAHALVCIKHAGVSNALHTCTHTHPCS